MERLEPFHNAVSTALEQAIESGLTRKECTDVLLAMAAAVAEPDEIRHLVATMREYAAIAAMPDGDIDALDAAVRAVH
jgi:N-acetylglucosamine kinase-like BadF-type ATPase